jgi:glucokinase
MSKYLIGLDIGGTKCAVVLGEINDDKVNILHKEYFLTETKKGVEQTLENIYKSIDKLMAMGHEVSAIGISCGGPLDSKRGVVMSPPNLPGWDNIHIVKLLEDRYHVKVGLQNDANACALAEWKFGAGRGYENVIFLTFGTGMGSGLILDGHLFAGTNDNAGEVGHVSLSENGPVGYAKRGSFEGFCSGGGISQLAATKALELFEANKKPSFCDSMSEIHNITAKDVAQAAIAGNKDAIEVYEISGRYLGKALSLLIDILNPEVIVIGSIFSRSQQLLVPAMQREIDAQALPLASKVCKIVPSGLGESLGDVAALSIASYIS